MLGLNLVQPDVSRGRNESVRDDKTLLVSEDVDGQIRILEWLNMVNF